ncbi:unnamed protein product [Schistocephalus solidus]|uniref:Reverse transcriptase domain-containing protein n=1 Tax=Schistocephalus solidus TaxID=70667 RepID=A0A183SKX3_SCHSO|nr:unnamed protein product [Schistocephalus solidus]
MFSAMLMDAYRYEQPGICIAYRTDGHLLSTRRMQAPTRVSTTTVHDLLFVDDCALNTVTEEDMQRIMVIFTTGCPNFGLTISTAKTVVMHQPPPNAEYNAPRINVNGSTLARNTKIDDEVAQRISKASQAFGRLQAAMRNRHGIGMKLVVVTAIAILLVATTLAQNPPAEGPVNVATPIQNTTQVSEALATSEEPQNGANVPGFVALPIISCGFVHLLARVM